MLETSDTTAALDEALAKAQGAVEIAKKDEVNPHFNYKYADLADVWRACRKALSENSVAVTQWPVHSEDGRAHIITRLAHKGEWMRAHFSIPVQQQNAHGYASAITYIKRIALTAAVGIASDNEDDDGNTASKPAEPARKPAKPVQQQTPFDDYESPNPHPEPKEYDPKVISDWSEELDACYSTADLELLKRKPEFKSGWAEWTPATRAEIQRQFGNAKTSIERRGPV